MARPRFRQKNFQELAQDFLYKIGRNIALEGNEVIDFTDDISRVRIDLLHQTFQRYGEPFYENYGRHQDANIMLRNLIDDELLVVNDVSIDYHGKHRIPRLYPATTLTIPSRAEIYERRLPQPAVETYFQGRPEYGMKRFLTNLRKSLVRFTENQLPRSTEEIEYIAITIRNRDSRTVKKYDIDLADHTIKLRPYQTETINRNNAHELFRDIRYCDPKDLQANCYNKNYQLSYSIRPTQARTTRAQEPAHSHIQRELQTIQRSWQVRPQDTRIERAETREIPEWRSASRASSSRVPKYWPSPSDLLQTGSSKLDKRDQRSKGNS